MEKAETENKESHSNVKQPEGVKDPKDSRVNFNAFPVISLSVARKNETLAALTENV